MSDRKIELAHYLELLSASISEWSPDLWNEAFKLAGEVEHPAANDAYEELIHYSGVFSSRNLLGFRVRPEELQLENFKNEFNEIAARLRSPI